MAIELVGSNLVITARQFNPSVFSQLWLVRNQILDEDDFRAGCLFSDQAVNVESEQFALLVVPPQLQFAPKVADGQEDRLVMEKVGAIVRALPHTPYIGVGLNFFWHIDPENGNVPMLTRNLFFQPKRGIYQFFDAEDARFGAYFSKDTLGCRLKLDVKPIIRPTPEESKEVLQYAFNFHLDLTEGNHFVDTIETHLTIWSDAKAEAARIVMQTVGQE